MLMQRLLVTAGMIITLGMGISGCSANHEISHGEMPDEHGKLVLPEEIKTISKDSRVYVAVPRNGRNLEEGNGVIKNSGKAAARTIGNEFDKYVRSVKTGDKRVGFLPALTMARSQGFDYFVYPIIQQWSDHATFWSGVPNTVRVNLRVYYVPTGQLLDAFTIKSESSSLSRPGQETSDLLIEPLGMILQDLTRKT